MVEDDTEDLEFLSIILDGVIHSKNLDISNMEETPGRLFYDLSSGPMLRCLLDISFDEGSFECSATPVATLEGEDLLLPPSKMMTSDPSEVKNWVESTVSDCISKSDGFMEILNQLPSAVFENLDVTHLGLLSDPIVSKDELGYVFRMSTLVGGIPYVTDLIVGVTGTGYTSRSRCYRVDQDSLLPSKEIEESFIAKTDDVYMMIEKIKENLLNVSELCTRDWEEFSRKIGETAYDMLLKEPGCFGDNVIAMIPFRR